MKKTLSTMILNGINIGINKIELNKSDLLITDKFDKYCLKVCVLYSWKDINKIKVGQKKKIDFNEYYLSENNEPALIFPSSSYVGKISDNYIFFDLEFKNLSNTVQYMNKKNGFDIKLNSLEVKVYIDTKDAIGNSIVYNLK